MSGEWAEVRRLDYVLDERNNVILLLKEEIKALKREVRRLRKALKGERT